MNYENIKKNTVSLLSKAKQSKAKQSKAKQSHNCILSNNLNFYILQIFKTLNFLGVHFVLQNIFSSLRRKVKKLIKNDIREEEILSLL